MSKHRARRWPIVVLAASMAIGGLACSDDNDGSAAGSATTGANAERADPGTDGPVDGGGDAGVRADEPRAAIQRLLIEVRRAFEQQNAASVCEVVTERATRRTAADLVWAAGSSERGDCETVMRDLIATAGEALHTTVKIVDARVDGDRARLTVESETGNAYATRAVLEDGRWKLDHSLIAGHLREDER